MLDNEPSNKLITQNMDVNQCPKQIYYLTPFILCRMILDVSRIYGNIKYVK